MKYVVKLLLRTLITPPDSKLFRLRLSTVKLVLCDRTAAISSAASSVILLLLKYSSVSDEVCCKAFATLITPVDCKLFSTRSSTFKLVLCDRIAAISSAASSVILLQLIYSLVSDEICCKALATLITPSNCKFFHED